VTDMYFR